MVWPGKYSKLKANACATVVAVSDTQKHTSRPGWNPGRIVNQMCRKTIYSILGNKSTCSNMLLISINNTLLIRYDTISCIISKGQTRLVICNTHSMIYCAWCRIEHDLVENRRHTVVICSYYGRLHHPILHCTNTIHHSQLYTTKLYTKHYERIL